MRARVLGFGARVLGGLLLVAGGCGHAKKQPAPMVAVSPDAGSDAMVVMDVDAAAPLTRPDAGMVPPGMPDPGLHGNCAVDSNKLYTVATSDTPFLQAPLAVDPVNSRFVVPYVASGDCLDAVHMASLAGAATSGEPDSAIAADDCALVRGAVATAIGDHWLLAIIDNRVPPYDIWAAPYDATQHMTGDAQRLTQDSLVETALALTTVRSGERAILAYANRDPMAGQTLYARPLDQNGMPLGDAVKLDQSSSLTFSDLSIKSLGADGAAVTYWRYSDDFSTSDLVFIALDNSGKPLRDPWVLASKAGPTASIDLSSDEIGGGIVYARSEAQTGREIWFQQIDDTGVAALGRTGTSRVDPLRVLTAPHKGIDVALAQLRSSFVLVYRALPDGTQTGAEIRVFFLDRFGASIGDSDVSFTSASSGRTAVQSANDGRVVLAWSELETDGSSAVKVMRLPCVGGQ